MNMRLFSLCRDGENIPVKLEIKIIGSLNNFADDDISFSDCTSLKELFGGLSGALKESEFVVIAVSGSVYNGVKLKLMKALSIKSEQNEAVLNKIKDLDLSQEAAEKNAAMPENATVFLSNDGVYSGFAVKKGKQTIAVIPLDETRTDAVLKRGLIPYITNGGTLVKAQPEGTKEPKPVQSVSAKKEEKAENIGDADYSQTETALRTLNILKESDVRIAVNANANSAVLKSWGESLEDFSEYFTFTPHIEDRGDYNVTDYTAQMAKSAKSLSGATLGACISDIFTTDECDFICIAVATDKSALVRKLYKEANETDEQFIKIATEELFALISEKASGNSAVGIEIAQDEAPNKTSFFQKKQGKITLGVIAVVLVAAAVVSVLFYINSKNKDEEITTEPTVTETVPVETTTEPVKVETMPLSKLIRYEAVNGIQDKKTVDEPTTEAGAIVPSNDETTDPVAEDPNAVPSVITLNGAEVEAKEAIARIVEAEMDKTYSAEALKAQAVVTYTYLKYRDTGWKISNVTASDTCSQEVLAAVTEVFGQYLAYNNKAAFTPYCLMSAGKTASSELVFGVKYDYLGNVASTSDKQRDNYKQETLVTADEIRQGVSAYDASINLGDDVSAWLKVVTHDAAVSTGTGYVEKMTVGDREVSGTVFIYDIMKDKNLASPCFSISYNSADNTFIITTFGSGYGVGMSQKGADRLAVSGSKYGKILDTYYPGTVLMAV